MQIDYFCPKCKGVLRDDNEYHVLHCARCSQDYPIGGGYSYFDSSRLFFRKSL